MKFIRKIEDKDIEEVGRIYLKSFDYPEEMLKFFTGLKEYVRYSMNQGYAYIAEKDVRCGVILAYEIPDMYHGKTLYIELLAVLPEYQKMGYATMLLNQIFEDAMQKGIVEIGIRTCCYWDAYQIYKKFGFKDSRSDSRYMYKILKK